MNHQSLLLLFSFAPGGIEHPLYRVLDILLSGRFVCERKKKEG